MGPGRPRSLATRLAAWYAATAFLLVSAAALIQYRTLVSSLAAEDDQLLAEQLDAARRETMPAPALSPGVRSASLRIRRLDEACRPLTSVAPGLPPPFCGNPLASDKASFRSWRSADGRSWRVASAHARRGGTGWIEVLLDRSKDDLVLRDYTEELSVVLGSVLLASGFLGYWIARRGLRPLATLGARMSRVTARSLDQRLSSPNAPAEISSLVGSFDAMLDRLEAAFAVLSQASAELAHELRTPLHVLRQRLEVAISRTRSAEEYREILVSSLDDLERLRRMTDDMLFLARTEDPRSSVDLEPLAIAGELVAVEEFLDAAAADAGITLETDAPSDLRVVADRMLVRRALVNLVTNSLRHTPAGGRVRLIAEAGSTGVRVSVEDDGAGIPEELLPRVFDRYFRGPGSPADGGHGAGLGLAIVQRIMYLHGGSVGISSVPGKGTRATLSFPGA